MCRDWDVFWVGERCGAGRGEPASSYPAMRGNPCAQQGLAETAYRG